VKYKSSADDRSSAARLVNKVDAQGIIHGAFLAFTQFAGGRGLRAVYR